MAPAGAVATNPWRRFSSLNLRSARGIHLHAALPQGRRSFYFWCHFSHACNLFKHPLRKYWPLGKRQWAGQLKCGLSCLENIVSIVIRMFICVCLCFWRNGDLLRLTGTRGQKRVNMCVCVCVALCMCICICGSVSLCISLCDASLCMYLCVRVIMYMCVCCVSSCVYLHVCVWVHVLECVYTYGMNPGVALSIQMNWELRHGKATGNWTRPSVWLPVWKTTIARSCFLVRFLFIQDKICFENNTDGYKSIWVERCSLCVHSTRRVHALSFRGQKEARTLQWWPLVIDFVSYNFAEFVY